MVKNNRTKILPNFLSLFMALFCLLTIFLIAYMLMTTFKERQDFIMNLFGFPETFTFENIVQVMSEGGLGEAYLNSIIVTALSVFFSLLVGSLTAYGLSRYRFKFNNVLYSYYMAGMIFPPMLALVPLFRLIRSIGLYNNLAGLILVYTAGLSFPVFILTGFFKVLPESLAECASIEGAGELRIFFTIMLPLAKPALATVAIFQAITAWNDMVIPMVLLTKPALKTITLALLKFMGQTASDWMSIFVGCTLSMLPIVLLYLVFSEQLVKGITAGSSK